MVTPRQKGLKLQGDALTPTAHLQEQIEEAGLSDDDASALLMGLAWASGYEVKPDLDALAALMWPAGKRAPWLQWLDPGDMSLVVLMARVSAHRAGVDWEAIEDAGADPALLRVIWSGRYSERTGPRAQGATMRVRE